MKKSGKVQILQKGSTWLEIPGLLAGALSLETGSRLHAVALEPREKKVTKKKAKKEQIPSYSVIASVPGMLDDDRSEPIREGRAGGRRSCFIKLVSRRLSRPSTTQPASATSNSAGLVHPSKERTQTTLFYK